MEEVKVENTITTEWNRRWAVLRWSISQNLAFIDFWNLPPDLIHRIKLEYPYSAEDVYYADIQENVPEVFQP